MDISKFKNKKGIPGLNVYCWTGRTGSCDGSPKTPNRSDFLPFQQTRSTSSRTRSLFPFHAVSSSAAAAFISLKIAANRRRRPPQLKPAGGFRIREKIQIKKCRTYTHRIAWLTVRERARNNQCIEFHNLLVKLHLNFFHEISLG